MLIGQSRVVKENLNKWDEHSPLTEEQIKSVLMLNHLNELDYNKSESDNTTDLNKENNIQILNRDRVLNDVSLCCFFIHFNFFNLI